MIENRKLELLLLPILALQWLGLSPRFGDFTPKRIATISLTTLIIISLIVGFYKSVFFISVLCSGSATLYYIGRNIFDNKDFKNLQEAYHNLNSPFKEVKYTFSWSFFFFSVDIILKLVVCFIKGITMADILIFIHSLKPLEIHILVYILRCQSELLKHGELEDYRLVNRGLASLRSYLLKQFPPSCFLCFIWSSFAAFIGITSFSKIILTDDGPVLHCSCFWASFCFAITSILALISSYNYIEEQKVEFEDRLYWKLVSFTQVWPSISPQHMMLVEISSRERNGETLKIDNTLIYSIVTSIGTFLVLLVQFELEDIICGRPKE